VDFLLREGISLEDWSYPIVMVDAENKLPPPAAGSSDSEIAREAGAVDAILPRRPLNPLPIAGIGGSAGSIPALQTFFSAISPDSGMAYVVVVHLSPEHESTLAAILQRCTTMPVTQVTGKTKVEPNAVYVIPPGKQLSMADGHLTLIDLQRTPGKRVAVDLFFRTLADTHGSKVCAIILSGSDSDGAIGIKRIKEMGGLTVVQDPNETQFDGMPRAAIATGMIDWILPVADMPTRLLAYLQNEERIRIPREEEPRPEGPKGKEAEDEAALKEVLSFLRVGTGRDFSYYKRATILRRIARRMQVGNILNLPDYVSFLRTHPREVGALLQDLLISVTNFFRDKEAFQALEGDISHLFDGKKASDQIRVWVSGCATGEEAYSMAMLLAERAATLASPPRIQIFATDIDENALNAAREGVYPETIVADISEERLRRFFVKEHHAYRLKRSLRETVLFALHDLLKDFPFSRIDLVSCRNLLIYLNRTAQVRAFDVFHFALRPEGRLFLGSSESADDAGPLFFPLDKKARLYARSTVPRTSLPSFSEPTTASRILGLRQAGEEFAVPSAIHFERDRDHSSSAVPLPTGSGISWTPSSAMTHLEEELERVKSRLRDTVEQFETGAQELKSSNEELQAMNEELRSATEELETSREELQSINEELTTVNQELKSKVEEVSRSNSDLQNLMSSTNIATIFLDRELHIKRYTPAAVPLFNLIHSDIGRPLTDLKTRFDYPGLAADAERVLENLALIEREVLSGDGCLFLARLLPYRTTEDQIGGVVLTFVDITQRKAVEEALRASQKNLTEELVSIEDLHEMTMRLLNTSDLSATLKEVLAAATRLNETDLGSVHLFDAAGNRLNLAAASGFGPEFAREYGSIDPAHDSTFARALKTRGRIVVEDYRTETGLADETRNPDALGCRAVLITPLTTRKGELLGIMSIHFRQAHRPTERDMQRTDLYARQAADLIERKLAEEALRSSEERIRAIVRQATVGIGQLDLNGRILFANPTLCGLLQQNEKDLLGKDVRELIPQDSWSEGEDSLRPLLEQGRALDLEKRYRRPDGSFVWVSLSMALARDSEGKPQFILTCVTDITQRLEDQKALKQALQENEKARAEIEASVMAKDRFLAVLSHELRTPLTPVLVTVGSLIRRTDLSTRVREGLELIRRNVQIESHFIDDLLDVTRISRDKFEVVRSPMDVHEAVQHAISISEADLQVKQQRLIVSLEAKETAINGDSARIQQIFWNILKNASKFSPNGTEIRLSTRNEGGQILVVISDSGMGIDPEVLPHIFDPFVQGGDTISREYSGLGLGLAISKAAIDAHGGTFQAVSAGRGHGATFTVTLPMMKSQA
jgi:two-component system CheB/CheR fusion protein